MFKYGNKIFEKIYFHKIVKYKLTIFKYFYIIYYIIYECRKYIHRLF